jgi:hypothetical protein
MLEYTSLLPWDCAQKDPPRGIPILYRRSYWAAALAISLCACASISYCLAIVS